MPRRSTKRGAERTALSGDYDAIVCGASFAGLATARELAGRPGAAAGPLRHRRAPDLGLRRAHRMARGARAGGLDPPDIRPARAPHAPRDRAVPAALDLLHLRLSGRSASCSTPRTTRSSRRPRSRDGHDARTGLVGVRTDRGEVCAPLVVDALGWRRVLGTDGYQPPDAPLSRGLEVHPGRVQRRARDLDRPLDRAGRLRLELPRGRTRCASASARSTRGST